MRIYDYFNTRYDEMRSDLKGLDLPMNMKVKLLQEIQDTVVMLKKVFQDNKDIDQRSLISGICKSIQTGSPMKAAFLMKFLKDFPGYNINIQYIMDNLEYIKSLTIKDCSKMEKDHILKGTRRISRPSRR